MSYELRSRKATNWKLLSNGEDIPKFSRVKIVQTLPETYEVERIITRKASSLDFLYLVKWSGYHLEESTWEPSSHLPKELADTYMTPNVSSVRLNSAAVAIENVIQQRLRSTNCRFVIDFELDIFRYCFGTDKAVLLEKTDFNKLPLSCHWNYLVNKNGRGVQISFPLKFEPKLWTRKVYFQKDGKIALATVPVEKLAISSAVDGIVL